MIDWWKIECLKCGVSADLLKDGHGRIICRECLRESEFNEVESELYAEDVFRRGKVPKGRGKLLRGSKTNGLPSEDQGDEQFAEMDEE